MFVDLHSNEPLSVEKGGLLHLYASIKSVSSDRPAQFAPADLGRNFWLLVKFPHFEELCYPAIRLIFKTESRMSKSNCCMTLGSNQ